MQRKKILFKDIWHGNMDKMHKLKGVKLYDIYENYKTTCICIKSEL